jgi:hypothetical protein
VNRLNGEVIKGLNVTKPATIKAPYATEPQQPATTPVQFLPSALLSWRAPIMARHGLPAKLPRKTAAYESSRLVTQ